MHDLAEAYRGWIEESIKAGNSTRDEKWTESVAVGSGAFVAATKKGLASRLKDVR
jgi:hypothetical protein